MQEKLRLKIVKKGDCGFQICNLSIRKLRRLAGAEHLFWSIESGCFCDFLVLTSY
jgi:hypothetical protein